MGFLIIVSQGQDFVETMYKTIYKIHRQRKATVISFRMKADK